MLLTRKQLAERLQVSERKIARLENEGLPVIVLGNNTKRYSYERVQTYLNNPLKQSVTLQTYLSGLEGIDLNKIAIMGEDFENNRMLIGIHDLPTWIKSGAKFELKMSREDIKLMKEYFEKL